MNLRNARIWPLILGVIFVYSSSPLAAQLGSRPQELVEVERLNLLDILSAQPNFCGNLYFAIAPDDKTILVSYTSIRKGTPSDKIGSPIGGYEYHLALIDRRSKTAIATRKLGREEGRASFTRDGDAVISVHDREVLIRDARTLELVASIPTGLEVDESTRLLRAQQFSLAVGVDLLAVSYATFSTERTAQTSPPNFGIHDLPVVIYDLEQRRVRNRCQLLSFETPYRKPIALSRDGQLLAFGYMEPSGIYPRLKLLEADSCQKLRDWTFNAPGAAIDEISFSANSKYVVVTFTYGRTKAAILRVSDGNTLLEIPNDSRFSGLDWSFSISKSEQWLAIDSTVYKMSFWEAFSHIGHVEQMGVDLWDIQSRRIVAKVRLPTRRQRTIPVGWGSGLRFSADDHFLINQAFDGTMRVYRVPGVP